MPELLNPESITRLLEPYTGSAAVPAAVYSQLASYLELILKWNARINLTAIREPEQIVQRHFGESLFVGLHLDLSEEAGIRRDSGESGECGPCSSLLDLGSGAGFPGIPIQLLRPELAITLTESRSRKAAFLREAVRVLGLKAEVRAGRAEEMPAERRFHTVALRAVDEMDAAVSEASQRASHRIMILGTRGAIYPTLAEGFRLADPIALPNSSNGVLWIARRTDGHG
jgi:16S rRNA (guanine527-N7)-methyltransferase